MAVANEVGVGSSAQLAHGFEARAVKALAGMQQYVPATTSLVIHGKVLELIQRLPADQVATLQALIVAEALAVPKRRKTTEELVTMMMRETERLQAVDRANQSVRRSRTLRRAAYWAVPIAAAAAAASLATGPRTALEERLAKLLRPEKSELAAPAKPKPDGG